MWLSMSLINLQQLHETFKGLPTTMNQRCSESMEYIEYNFFLTDCFLCTLHRNPASTQWFSYSGSTIQARAVWRCERSSSDHALCEHSHAKHWTLSPHVPVREPAVALPISPHTSCKDPVSPVFYKPLVQTDSWCGCVIGGNLS